jgi:hypothetical protein
VLTTWRGTLRKQQELGSSSSRRSRLAGKVSWQGQPTWLQAPWQVPFVKCQATLYTKDHKRVQAHQKGFAGITSMARLSSSSTY